MCGIILNPGDAALSCTPALRRQQPLCEKSETLSAPLSRSYSYPPPRPSLRVLNFIKYPPLPSLREEAGARFRGYSELMDYNKVH